MRRSPLVLFAPLPCLVAYLALAFSDPSEPVWQVGAYLPLCSRNAALEPTVTATDRPAAAPDLTIVRMWHSFEDESCTYGQPLGVFVEVANIGDGGAGPFVVLVNAKPRAVPGGLAANRSVVVWVPPTAMPSGGGTLAIVDRTNVVKESREDNNRLSELLPVPTPPRDCATPTPASSRPDLAIRWASIALEDGGCWYGQPLGTWIGFENRGSGGTGPFVVRVNEDLRAYPAGLAPGKEGRLWLATNRELGEGETVAMVDASSVVIESDEQNNRYGEILPLPTRPGACPAPTTLSRVR